MPFEKLIVEDEPAAAGTGIKVGLASHKATKCVKLRLSISVAVAEKLGWADGDGIEAQLGTGADRGRMRLRKNRSTASAALKECAVGKGERRYFRLNLGRQDLLPNRIERGQFCAWEGVDGWIEVTLPKWAHGPALQPRAQADAAVPSGKDVTASLMGDPPPGRRAMLETIGKVKAK